MGMAFVMLADFSWVRTGAILLPLLLGAGAVYFLLPQPRGRKVLLGSLLGLVALALAGWLLGRFLPLDLPTFLFYAFSAMAVVSGALLITQRNPARAALSFALVILSSTGLFLLLAAPFLMAATVIVYAGAIIVTFLFVLMLAQQVGPSDADERTQEPLMASITGFLLLGALLLALDDSFGLGAYRDTPADGVVAEGEKLLERIAKLQERTQKARKQPDKEGLLEVVGEKDNTPKLYTAYNKLFDDKELEARAAPTPPEAKKQIQQWREQIEDDDFLDFLVIQGGFKEASLEDSQEALDKMLAVLEIVQKTMIARVHEEQEQARLASIQTAQDRVTLRPDPGSPVSNLSGPPANVPLDQLRRDPSTGLPALPAQNAAYLGKSLFTAYLLPVELAGTLLLVAAVGAIAIAGAHRRIQRDRTSPPRNP
jgi:NADH-quinone oxidoreductase subunit J